MDSVFLDSGGRNNNHKKKKTNELVTTGPKETNSELYIEFPTLETSVGKNLNEPIGVTQVMVIKSVGSLNDATVYTNVSTEAPNKIGPTNNVVNLESTPKSLTKSNLRKLEANVPNSADYGVQLPLALV
ncbi:hypothetical protein Tco_1458913 [Tanacetum coccineum]